MKSSTATQPGLPDRLNYRCLVAPGVMELGDGAFLTGFEYAGPDQEYEDFLRMGYLADQINADLAKLSRGWMSEAHALRVPIVLPVTVHHCPDPTSAMVAEERAERYAIEGGHYETRYVLTLTYAPPSAVKEKFTNYFFETSKITKRESRSVLLRLFQDATEQITQALGHNLSLWQLNDAELVHFLRLCVTGEDRAVNVPEDKGHLNYIIGDTTLDLKKQMVGDSYFRVVGITGFPERGTRPQMFADILTLPYPLRIAQRFIALSVEQAVKELENKANDWGQKNWFNPKALAWRTVSKRSKDAPEADEVVSYDTDAENQRQSVKRTITEIREGRLRGGYYTYTCVIMDPDEATVQAHALEVMRRINRLGFTARIEKPDNAADALRGSWSGHGMSNVRRPMLTSRHFAQMMPTSQPWRGEKTHPNPYYPKGSGPLLITTSTGNTPFFLNTHDERGLGNFLVIGPSGNGKTYILNAIAMAHLQYERAQVNCFDRDAGAVVPTLACGGEFFDLDAMNYAPLAHINEPEEQAWALLFIEKLAALRNFKLTPLAQESIATALRLLGDAPIEHRTMTHLLDQIQTHEEGLKEALSFYTLGNPGAILDGVYSSHQDSHFLTYDMEKLLGRGAELSTPVLSTLIHQIGRRLDGRPSLTTFDEGWIVAGEELLREYIEETSATNRKKAASFGLVLHSPGDLSIFPHADRLLSNVSTLIILPNDKALTEGPGGLKKHYESLGLNSRQIRIVAEEMRSRRDYMALQGNKCRVFDLASNGLEHALLRVNGRDYRDRVLQLRKQYREVWLPGWLTEQGEADLATKWNTRGGFARREHPQAVAA